MEEEIENVEQAKTADIHQLKNLNTWLIWLSIFLVLWTTGVFMLVNKRIEANKIPVITLDPMTGTVTNGAYSNLVPKFAKERNALLTTKSPSTNQPFFETKDKYKVGELVMINYFYVTGLIVDVSGDDYTVMYKDHNYDLQRVIVPKSLLLVPTSAYVVNPLSLLTE